MSQAETFDNMMAAVKPKGNRENTKEPDTLG